MFDKILSKVGIGNAKVNTLLHQSEVMRGELVTGEVHLTGGKVAQEVRQLYLDLFTSFEYERDGRKSTQTFQLYRLHLSDAFTLDAGEEAIFDFELEIPVTAPVSIHRPSLHLVTGLDVAFAFDPKDRDPITVLPDPATAQILVAAEQIGFGHSHESGRCIEFANGSGVPYVQEFVFKPQQGSFVQRVEELEMLVISDGDIAQVILEIDRRNRGVGGWIADAMDMDERSVHLEIAHDHPFSPQDLAQIIEENLY
jgi:sporulation-control protein